MFFMPYQNILTAFDGSALSVKALEKAIKFAQDHAARLEVIHVCHIPVPVFGGPLYAAPFNEEKDYLLAAQAMIDEAKRLTSPLPEVNVILKQGEPALAILEYAEESGSDLIIMGSRGLSGLREFVLGSVSHHVVQHSKVPVLIVK